VQGPHSGIKPHSDKNNFIITAHLGLDVPEGDCWIKVSDRAMSMQPASFNIALRIMYV
jgi:aspartyl/asparaginyl beta-hydroxylase (cupin superfamily)